MGGGTREDLGDGTFEERVGTRTRREAWAEARRLVVQEHASYGDAAAATGIPISTLQKRAAAEGWQADRDHSMSYEAQIRALKSALLARALKAAATEGGEDDPSQMVFAWQKAEAAFPEHRYTQRAEDPQLRLAVAMEVLQEIYAYFAESDSNVLALLRGHATPITKRLGKKYGAP